MKMTFTFFTVALMTLPALAGKIGSAGKALDAAIAFYGNNPHVSKIRMLESDPASDTVDYHVSMGQGNVEAGEKIYNVRMVGKSTPVVTEIPRF